MTQRPLTIPRPHFLTHLLGLRQVLSGGEIPHHDYTLHRPYPRCQLLNALLTEVLRRFDVHDLFARSEQHLNRPAPRELNNNPTHAGFKHRREQIDVLHLTQGVTDHHNLNRPQAQHTRPHRLIAHCLQLALLAVDHHAHQLPQPLSARRAFAIRLRRRFLGFGQPQSFFRFTTAFALSGLGRLRIVHGRIATHPTNEAYLLCQVGQQLLASVSAIAYKGKATRGEPDEDFGEHLSGQDGTAGLALAWQVQSRQDGQRQDRTGGEGNANGHGQHDPVVPRGGGYPATGARDGIAEPAHAPDLLAAFVGQRVIDQQGDGTEPFESRENEQGDLVGQVFGIPGRAFKEVVVDVQAMALGVVGCVPRVDRMTNVPEVVLAQAHDPAKQQLGTSTEGWLRENRRKPLDEGLQRGYHIPHGRGSFLKALVIHQHRRSPPLFHPTPPSRYLASCSGKPTEVQISSQGAILLPDFSGSRSSRTSASTPV